MVRTLQFFMPCWISVLLTGTIPLAHAQSQLRKPDSADLKKVEWKVGDVTRTALVSTPAKNGKKHPLIMVFHGHGGRSEFVSRQFGFQKLWPEAVVVYPQGLPTAVPKLDPSGKMPGWQIFAGHEGDRDLHFFDAMLKTMLADYDVDEKRVYVVGHSNGGFFTYVLCATRSEKLAAVAPVAALLSLLDLKNQKPIPLIHVAGEKDTIVPFSGQERTIEQVRKLNGCEAEGKPAGKYCTLYESPKGTPVVAYIHPGNHGVPKGVPERIVEFFKDQQRK